MYACFPKLHRAARLSAPRTRGDSTQSPPSETTHLPSLEPSRHAPAQHQEKPNLYPLAIACAFTIKIHSDKQDLASDFKLLAEQKHQYLGEKRALEQQERALADEKEQVLSAKRALQQQKYTLETKEAQIETLQSSLPFLQAGADENAQVRLRTSDDQILVYHRNQYQGTGSFFDAAARWKGSDDAAILVPFSKKHVKGLMEELICKRHEVSDIDLAARDYFLVDSAKLNHKNPDDIARVVGDIMNALFRAFKPSALTHNGGKRVKISAQFAQNLEDFLNGLRPLDPNISAYPQIGEEFRLIVPEVYRVLGQYRSLPAQEPQNEEFPNTGLGIDLAQYFIHTPLSVFYRRKELEAIVDLFHESDQPVRHARISLVWMIRWQDYITKGSLVPGCVTAFRDSDSLPKNVIEFLCQVHGFPRNCPENWDCGLGLTLTNVCKYYDELVVSK